MRQFYYPIKEIIAEVQEKALYRSKILSQGENGSSADALLLSDQDSQLVIDLLKSASDEAYSQIRSLAKSPDGSTNTYEFDSNVRIVFTLYPRKNFDLGVLPVLYTAIKDFIVEGTLLGFYEDIGFVPGVEMGERKKMKLVDRIREYRLSTKRPVRKKYTMI